MSHTAGAKIAVVTGAAAGIGMAIAARLAGDGLFLASESAGYITGTAIPVDGGFMAAGALG
jgi:NAD(P)-dependent dehydrogenase (short-subunit alcohol dehydrogenase family)